MGSTSSLYAAIDLGSNSFHMLVVREVAGSIQTLTRLYDVAFYADDLDALNELSELICAAECGEHIEPYKLGNIA